MRQSYKVLIVEMSSTRRQQFYYTNRQHQSHSKKILRLYTNFLGSVSPDVGQVSSTISVGMHLLLLKGKNYMYSHDNILLQLAQHSAERKKSLTEHSLLNKTAAGSAYPTHSHPGSILTQVLARSIQ